MVREATMEKWPGFEITEIVSGHARGVDQLGERYAHEQNIPLKLFPAEWDRLVAICLNNSRDTSNMIKEAGEHKLKLIPHNVQVEISIVCMRL